MAIERPEEMTDTQAVAHLYRSHADFVKQTGEAIPIEEYIRRVEKAEPYEAFIRAGGADGVAAMVPSQNWDLFNVLVEARKQTDSDDSTVVNDWVRLRYETIMGLAKEPIAAQAERGETIEKTPL